MKMLSGVQILNVNGSDRIAFVYDEVNDENGEIVSYNNSGTFVVTDQKLRSHVNAIREYVRKNKLSE